VINLCRLAGVTCAIVGETIMRRRRVSAMRVLGLRMFYCPFCHREV
jgi:hypothetical protein